PDAGGADGAGDHLRHAVPDVRRAALGGGGVRVRAAGARRRHRELVAARNAVLAAGRRRIHRAMRRRGAERRGDGERGESAEDARRGAAVLGWRGDGDAAGADDGAGGGHRLLPDGAVDARGRGGAEAVGDRRYWRGFVVGGAGGVWAGGAAWVVWGGG